VIAWTVFYHPLTLSFEMELWLVLPLLAAVGVIYKTIRMQNLRQLPKEIILLMGYMAAGLAGLCAVMWLIQAYWP